MRRCFLFLALAPILAGTAFAEDAPTRDELMEMQRVDLVREYLRVKYTVLPGASTTLKLGLMPDLKITAMVPTIGTVEKIGPDHYQAPVSVDLFPLHPGGPATMATTTGDLVLHQKSPTSDNKLGLFVEDHTGPLSEPQAR